MSKYEVISRIMNSNKISEEDKVYEIEMFLKGYFTSEQLVWIWEEE